MVPDKSWKTDAIARLLLSIFISMYTGSIIVCVLNVAFSGGKTGPLFVPAAAGAIGLLGGALFATGTRWTVDNLPRQLGILAACFYGGLALGIYVHKISPSYPISSLNILVSTVSTQGLAIVWSTRFLHEHELTWSAAFGFSNQWKRALGASLLVGLMFLPIGQILQQLSAWTLQELQLDFQAQEAVRIMQNTTGWGSRVWLGVVIVFLAPVAEETIFRGIIYPAIKHAGFPRLALWGSAALFALIHVSPPIFIPLMALAIVLTLLYERTENLLAPICAHALFNAVNFVALFYNMSTPES